MYELKRFAIAWNLMWGLTIPTWGGGQDYTRAYLVEDDKLFIYRNWTKDFSSLNRLLRQRFRWTRGNPTHDIHFVRKLNIRSELDGHDTAIILCQNEKANRALWEVGYMLENMFIQARGLGISYESKIFKIEEIPQLAEVGLAGAATAVLL